MYWVTCTFWSGSTALLIASSSLRTFDHGLHCLISAEAYMQWINCINPSFSQHPNLGCLPWLSSGVRLSSLLCMCETFWGKTVGSCPFSRSANSLWKPITLVTNWHGQMLLSHASCCVLRCPSLSNGKHLWPEMLLSMPSVFLLFSAWLRRN